MLAVVHTRCCFLLQVLVAKQMEVKWAAAHPNCSGQNVLLSSLGRKWGQISGVEAGLFCLAIFKSSMGLRNVANLDTFGWSLAKWKHSWSLYSWLEKSEGNIVNLNLYKICILILIFSENAFYGDFYASLKRFDGRIFVNSYLCSLVHCQHWSLSRRPHSLFRHGLFGLYVGHGICPDFDCFLNHFVHKKIS